MSIRLALATLTVLLANPAWPLRAQTDTTSAEFLIEDCRSALDKNPSSVMEGYCMGAVIALVDAGPYLPEPARSCTPKEVTLKEAIRVVVNYADAHREMLPRRFTSVVSLALKQAWPCKGAGR